MNAMNAPVFEAFARPALPAAYRARSLHLIDGRLVEPDGGTWFDAVDPCTGAVIAQIAEGNQADIDRAVAAARPNPQQQQQLEQQLRQEIP